MELRRIGTLTPAVRRSLGAAMWRASQIVCSLCCLGAVLVLAHPPFGRAQQICVAALLLIGLTALITGRFMSTLAGRRSRRRLTVY